MDEVLACLLGRQVVSDELLSKYRDDGFLSAVLQFLRNGGQPNKVYDQSEAFEAFIGNGGNVFLYESAVRFAVQEVGSWSEGRDAISMLDLGVGSGKLLMPLLSGLRAMGYDVSCIDLVDASEAMKDGLKGRCESVYPDACVREHCLTFEQFMESSMEDARFDVCIASFALQYCVEKRDRLLQWIRKSCRFFVLFEFDVDDEMLHERPLDDLGRCEALVSRYRRGLHEYDGLDCRDLVLNGFLVPVFCSNFARACPQMSREMSMLKWKAALEHAKFDDVRVTQVWPYWWGDCKMFVCTNTNEGGFDRSAYVCHLIQVEDYGKKGRGFKAVGSIEAGTILLREKPMVVDLDSDASRYQAIAYIVEAGLASNDRDGYTYLMENSFKVGHEVHVFRRKSLFNHSCFCNAAEIDGAVVSLRTIEPGEEVTISYISGVLHSSRTMLLMMPNHLRKPILKQHIFGFECLCGRCCGHEAQEIEKEMTRVVDISGVDWHALPRDFLQAPASFHESFVKDAKDRLAKCSLDTFAIAPLLPGVAVLTMDPFWIEACAMAFRKWLPPNFPATKTIEDMLAMRTSTTGGGAEEKKENI